MISLLKEFVMKWIYCFWERKEKRSGAEFVRGKKSKSEFYSSMSSLIMNWSTLWEMEKHKTSFRTNII